MLRRDLRSNPVRRLVVMGESNAYGMCAGDPMNEWVQALAFSIRRFQDGSLRVFNNSKPSDVISPNAPAYTPVESAESPTALDRFEKDMIGYRPDLAIYAYGLNDSRCGHAAASFVKDYEKIVSATRKSLPEALIVLAGPYWNLQYDWETWNKDEYRNNQKSAFGVGGDELVLQYNLEIRNLAARHDALFVDLYRMLEGASWLLHCDTCHFNDLGQWMIGQMVFAEIACNCSFLSTKSLRACEESRFTIQTTGGTNALAKFITRWRKEETWRA